MIPLAIVGAGIGGLSAALGLQRLGRDVAVYEQADELGEVGAGIGLWPGALKSLASIGIAEGFWGFRRCPFREAETATPDGRSLVRFDVTGITWDAPGFVLRRADLHRTLVDSLAPGTVTLSSAVVGVRQDADAVTLSFADGREVRAGMVVGADGVNSAVRRSVVGDGGPRYSGETCYRGLARMSVADTGMLREVQGRGLRCAVHPLDDASVYWWAARRAPAGVVEAPEHRKQELSGLFAGWRFGFPEALAATPAEIILKNDLFDRPPLDRWSYGRVTLLGDAAHPTTPNLGLGGCMAIEDALVLARAIDENDGRHTAAFAQYERERRPRTRRAVRMSALFGRIGSLTNPVAARARDLTYALTPTSVMARGFAQEVGYGPGPLRREPTSGSGAFARRA